MFEILSEVKNDDFATINQSGLLIYGNTYL